MKEEPVPRTQSKGTCGRQSMYSALSACLLPLRGSQTLGLVLICDISTPGKIAPFYWYLSNKITYLLSECVYTPVLHTC